MIRFVKNQKGGSNLEDANGFLYRVSKVNAATDKTYWNCVARQRDSCRATAITVTSSQEIYKLMGDHNHGNRRVERLVKEVEKENITAAALLPTVAPRSILGAISVSLESKMPGSSAFISHRQNINQAIHKQRKLLKGYPSQAKDFEDLINIPDQFSTTADKKPFLVLNDSVIPNNPIPKAPRILVFMSDVGKEVLAGCKSWYVDGTFKPAVNTLFSQVVFIVGLTGMDKAVPCAFALLPSKEKECYIRLAACVKTELQQLAAIPKLQTIMMDFEIGLIKGYSYFDV
jgi:hypothetical protein